MSMTASGERVAVCVATYRRPALLRDLLESLELAAMVTPLRVVLVDNDPTASARGVAAGSSLEIDYVVEPNPGIASARNVGLDRLRPDDDYLVFVDDDERVSPDWLRRLLDAASSFAADVVAGPVVSVFIEGTPSWVERGGFLQRARFPSGTRVTWSPATNNTLVRTAALHRAGNPRFDESFSMTGGSDTDFFWRFAHAAEPKMVWCDEALVYEDVPLSRATPRWVWRRGVRVGNVKARLLLRRRSRIGVFGYGIGQAGYGAVRVILAVALRRGLRAADLDRLTRGVGAVGACLNRNVVEYARRQQPERRRAGVV